MILVLDIHSEPSHDQDTITSPLENGNHLLFPGSG